MCDSQDTGAARGYVINKNNRECVKDAFRVMTRGEKGLLLKGAPGSGKTKFFELFREWVELIHDVRLYSILDCEEIAGRFDPDEGWDFKSLVGFYGNLSNRTVFDDLHRNTHKREVMRSIIRLRAKRPEYVTHFTTNFSTEQLAARYGDDVASRLLGMCRMVEFFSPYKDMRAVV